MTISDLPPAGFVSVRNRAGARLRTAVLAAVCLSLPEFALAADSGLSAPGAVAGSSNLLSARTTDVVLTDAAARQNQGTATIDDVQLMGPGVAAGRALDTSGGRVLNVVLEHGSAGPYYRVRLLHDGQVRAVHIDARP